VSFVLDTNGFDYIYFIVTYILALVPSRSASHLLPSEFVCLSEELAFVQDHDEHADIASGNVITDESVVTDIVGLPDEEVLTEEDVGSDETSVVSQFLKSILNQVKKEIEIHRQPLCYRNGDFFIRPKHPTFMLHDAAIHGLKPDHLCHRRVFIWLPSCLPGAPDSFKCECGMPLAKNGEFFFKFPSL
jgi:hypothetical protein